MKNRLLKAILFPALVCSATLVMAQASLEKYAPPPVITPAHAPGQCLDLSLDNPAGDFVQLWQCWPGWNQSFRFDGDADGGILWAGGLTCLQSTGNSGERVTMRPCDGSANQRWRHDGNRFIDFAGKCLNASGASAGNGTWIIVWDCVGETNEQWHVSTLDVEYVKGPGVTAPPDLLPADSSRQYGNLPSLLEQDRPRFTARTPTRAEQAEAARLAKPYMKVNVLTHFNDREDLTGMIVPWATIKRLAELAESGDKALMHTLLQVMRVALRINESNAYNSSYDPADDGSFSGGDLQFAWLRLNQLTMVWSAHYWQRHGPDRLAAYAFIECWPSNERCGYTYMPIDWEQKYLPNYAETGKRKDLFEIEDIRFWPVDGDSSWRQTRFEQLIGYLSSYVAGSNYRMSDSDYAWMDWYARQSGQLDTFRYAWTQTVWNDERYRSPHEIYYRTQADMTRWVAQFEQEMLLPQPSNYLKMLIKQMGDEYLLRYAQKFEPDNYSQIERICTLGSPDCERHMDAYEQHIADAARQKEEEARMAAAFASQSQRQNSLVTVRQYDQNGNYVGSRVDTAIGAELSGAK